MEILKFKISGMGATFTRPYINSTFTSYSHIHKVAILGLLGAVIGIQKEKNLYVDSLPPFYTQLKNFKISIVPKKAKFPSKVSNITETSGMFNKNSTFLVAYEELIRPEWDIYVYGEDENFSKIKDYILNRKSVFIPYLGKNHFEAKISNMKLIEDQPLTNEICRVDSLFREKDVESIQVEQESNIYLKEGLPIGINNKTFQYDEDIFVFTDGLVKLSNLDNIKKCENKIIYFV